MQVLSLMLWSGALHDRLPFHSEGLIHHSDRGSQYVCIKYTDRLVGVDWFNEQRLLEPIGYIPPIEDEEQYYAGTGQ